MGVCSRRLTLLEGTTNTNMFTFVTLVAMSGVAMAQQTPQWLLKPGLSKAADCEPSFAPGANDLRKVSVGPNSICIRFPPSEKTSNKIPVVRYDTGLSGAACNDGCCEFIPPLSNKETIENLRNKQQPKWFESSGDCSNSASAKEAPLLFKGTFDEPKGICLFGEEGYKFVEGGLTDCANDCCIFRGPGQ